MFKKKKKENKKEIERGVGGGGGGGGGWGVGGGGVTWKRKREHISALWNGKYCGIKIPPKISSAT